LVLTGADGVVFVADSSPEKRQENIDSLKNLEENLAEHGVDIRTVPLVLQYNKRDLPVVMPVEEMSRDLNRFGAVVCEAVAFKGEGVLPTLKQLAKLVLEGLNKEYGPGKRPATARIQVAGAAGAVPASPTVKPPPPAPTVAAPSPPPSPRAVTPVAPRPVVREAPKFVPKSPSKPVRTAPIAVQVPAPVPVEKGGWIWIVAAVAVAGAAAAVYFLFLRS
jgi:hypothetical protein